MINEGYEQMLDGWWNDFDTEVLESNMNYLGGWSEWGFGESIEVRVDRIEEFLRENKLIKINVNGDETEVRYLW